MNVAASAKRCVANSDAGQGPDGERAVRVSRATVASRENRGEGRLTSQSWESRGKAGEGPPRHDIASIVVSKRLGGDPARPAAAADRMRAGGERHLAASLSSMRRSRESVIDPRHCNEPREGRGPASRLRLSRHATRGPGGAPPRHADAATSRGSRGEHRGEGRGSDDEPQKG